MACDGHACEPFKVLESEPSADHKSYGVEVRVRLKQMSEEDAIQGVRLMRRAHRSGYHAL